ncbi:uncharacterized protein [Scyliorhinus torazame]|uniref:uncharacterized protein n=1 Tax=Scyliorhinus torazame TaxID=75743 RepID=UPI003B594948
MKFLLLILGFLIGDFPLSGQHNNARVWLCCGTTCIVKTEQVPRTWMCGDALDNRWHHLYSCTGLNTLETTVNKSLCCTGARGTVPDTVLHCQNRQLAGETCRDLSLKLKKGNVPRKVCLSWEWEPCIFVCEMKIRKCTHNAQYQFKLLKCCAACCTEPEPSTPRTTKGPPSVESTDRSSSVALEATTLTSGASKAHITEESSPLQSTGPSSPAAVEPTTLRTSTIQERESPATPKYTDKSSNQPTAPSTSDAETSTIQGSKESTTPKCTDMSSGKPTATSTSDSGRSTNPGKVETTQSDAECKRLDGTHFTPALLLDITDGDCEAINAEVQVMYVGKNKPENTEEMKAHLRQVQKMLKDYLPCKNLVPND